MNSKIINRIYIDINKQLQIQSYNKKQILNNCKKLIKKVISLEKTQIMCNFHKVTVQKIQKFHKALLKLQI
jgi:hypothetical protein